MNLTSDNLLKNITFKSTSFCRNYDFFDDADNTIIEIDGLINRVNIETKSKPTLIGEYSLSMWNLTLMRLFNHDIVNLLNHYDGYSTYEQFKGTNLIKESELNKFNKIIFIHTIVIHPKFRKMGVFSEFIESIYRTYYSEDTLIITLAKPFQNNEIDEDYYRLRRNVIIDDTTVSAFNYYSLKEYYNKTDTELNEYKLFNIVGKCGFDRISNTNLFVFNIDKFLNKLKNKYKIKTII